ncbi:MAG: hypothetical protein ACQES2_11585, partial [Pseudomonadota bacterium]
DWVSSTSTHNNRRRPFNMRLCYMITKLAGKGFRQTLCHCERSEAICRTQQIATPLRGSR